MQNGVLKVRIENYKKIDALDLNLEGKSIWLIGDNEVGKSSFLQAIFSLLSNEPFPENSITQGKEAGFVETQFMVDGKRYTARRVFNEKHPRGRFELVTEEGLKTDKVGILASLVGNISFDPFEFVEWSGTADGRRKQAGLVRQLIPTEINEKIAEADALYGKNYAARATLTAKVKDARTYLERFNLTAEDKTTYAAPVDVEALQIRLRDLNALERKVEAAAVAVSGYRSAYTRSQERIKELEEQVKLEKAKMAMLKADAERAEKERKAIAATYDNAERDATEEKITKAAEHNMKAAQVQQFLKAEEEFNTLQAQWGKHDENCSRCLTRKQEMIKEAGLPIDGLTFDDQGIYLNGMPVSEDQISTSQIMEIGVKIQTTLNPKLRILRVNRAESLGKKRREAIVEYCKKNKFQLFGEKVVDSVDKLTVEFIEE